MTQFTDDELGWLWDLSATRWQWLESGGESSGRTVVDREGRNDVERWFHHESYLTATVLVTAARRMSPEHSDEVWWSDEKGRARAENLWLFARREMAARPAWQGGAGGGGRPGDRAVLAKRLTEVRQRLDDNPASAFSHKVYTALVQTELELMRELRRWTPPFERKGGS